MNLKIIWNNGEKQVLKNIPLEIEENIINRLLMEKGFQNVVIYLHPPHRIINLEFAREIYLEE